MQVDVKGDDADVEVAMPKMSSIDLGGNAATMYVLIFALLAGTIGVVSVLTGLKHLHSWRTESMAAADSSAAISFSVMALAFGVVWKEIAIGGQRGKQLQTLEVFVILSTFTQMLYLMLLHAGMCYSRYGPSYGNEQFCCSSYIWSVVWQVCQDRFKEQNETEGAKRMQQAKELNYCLHQYTNDDVLEEMKRQYMHQQETKAPI
ncbi:Membrane protein PM19L-like protein [Drosera capensis]